MSDFWLLAGQLVLIAAAAGVVSYGLIVILGASFARYALAQPNARSSHKQPTPQGGGIAVIGATIVVIAGCVLAGVDLNDMYRLGMVLCAAVLLALVGAIDDVRPLGAISTSAADRSRHSRCCRHSNRIADRTVAAILA